MNKKCDLHIHTLYSDSDLSVEECFRDARRKELSCIAITDHDTMSGIKEARVLSSRYGIELIEAIEFSAQEADVEVHVLGYFLDAENQRLQEALAVMETHRRERLNKMADKLNDIGVRVDKEELTEKVRNKIPTRLHLGLYLLEKKRVSALRDAFRKYLSPGKPAYLSRFKFTVQESIEIIKDAGGLAFLAHPHMISDQSWIEKFIRYGIAGLEVSYPHMSVVRRNIYENMCRRYGLLRSGGSDAHGSYKKYTEIGAAVVPYAWVEEMKRARACRETQS
ncbi:MAG: PHP domain-containing protein [Candidatus Omnitrophica bacterium]|nr:PHP domain-containing protein [Candidatus Omnitrophota bacterium]